MLSLRRERDRGKEMAELFIAAKAGAAIGEEALGLGAGVAAGALDVGNAEPAQLRLDIGAEIEQRVAGTRGRREETGVCCILGDKGRGKFGSHFVRPAADAGA